MWGNPESDSAGCPTERLISVGGIDIQSDTVGEKLTPRICGQPVVANTVLAQPSDSDPEAIVRTYKRVMVEDGGVSLNIDQLKQLALVLVHRTAIGNPTGRWSRSDRSSHGRLGPEHRSADFADT